MATGESRSVIVPSWREGVRLLDALRAARAALGECELVVAASEEPESIRDAAVAQGAVWVESPRANRGLQLRLGAERARGEQLVFLHADTRLPVDASRNLDEAFAVPGMAGGAFRLRFDVRHPVLDVVAWASRAPFPTLFLGDQCMFCRRDAYVGAGGFHDMPLFEDVDLARRLAQIGTLIRLRDSVTTSSRRFVEHGPFRQLTRNALLMLAYHAGVGPNRLAAWYGISLPEAAEHEQDVVLR